MGQGVSTSNDVILQINNHNFKSFCASDIVRIPPMCQDIDDIVDSNVSVTIGNVYTISTPVGTSVSGQVLTGEKLIICGKVCVDINILPTCDNPIYNYSYTVPFCTFIVVPTGFIIESCTDISYTIENITIEKLDRRQLVTCVNILFEA